MWARFLIAAAARFVRLLKGGRAARALSLRPPPAACVIYSRYWNLFSWTAVAAAALGLGTAAGILGARIEVISSPGLRYSLAVSVVLTGAFLLLGLATVLHDEVRRRSEAARSRRGDQLQGLLAGFAAGEAVGDELDAAARADPGVFLTEVGQALDVLKGSQRHKLQEVCSRHHRRLLREVTASNPNRVVRAICLLGKLDSDEAREAITEALEHPTPRVRTEARVAVLHGSDWVAQCGVLAESRSLEPWERAVLYHNAPENTELLSAFLAAAFQSGRPEMQLAALELILSQQAVFVVDEISSLFESRNPEVRARLFEALPYLAGEQNLKDELASGLADADDRVRRAAIRACSRLPTPEVCDQLLALVHASSDFDEVFGAVRALKAAGAPAFDRLQGESMTGREMASRAVAEVLERDLLTQGPKAP